MCCLVSVTLAYSIDKFDAKEKLKADLVVIFFDNGVDDKIGKVFEDTVQMLTERDYGAGEMRNL